MGLFPSIFQRWWPEARKRTVRLCRGRFRISKFRNCDSNVSYPNCPVNNPSSESKKCYAVGIAGGSASGKSTLTKEICDRLTESQPKLAVRTISTDAYFRRGKDGAPTLISATTGVEEFDCNQPNSIDVTQLLSDMDLQSKEADLLIVEGLMILHLEQLRERFDLKIFVDTDADVRALRRMLRDLKGGRMFSDPDNIARYYLESAKPGHERYVEPSKIYADIIVRGDRDFTKTANFIVDMVLSKVS
jgi:uridine kinase